MSAQMNRSSQVTHEELADVIANMAYADIRDECVTYRAMCKRRGWTTGRFSDWLRDRVAQRILDAAERHNRNYY